MHHITEVCSVYLYTEVIEHNQLEAFPLSIKCLWPVLKWTDWKTNVALSKGIYLKVNNIFSQWFPQYTFLFLTPSFFGFSLPLVVFHSLLLFLTFVSQSLLLFLTPFFFSVILASHSFFFDSPSPPFFCFPLSLFLSLTPSFYSSLSICKLSSVFYWSLTC